jgi:endonuclease/exonuclease/phosphatase family metal-dependent hydrolase
MSAIISPVYKFSSSKKEWLISPRNIELPTAPSSFKIMTLNVLFDQWGGKPYKEHVVCSLERYQQQFKEMKIADCDIITLNEVTTNYVALITQEEWVQNSYYMSDISGDTISGFGNLILSKLPIAELCLKSITKLLRPIVCAKFSFKNTSIIVAAAHLSARKENHERRQNQVKELTAFLEQKFSKEEKIILGDLNYHSEDEILPEGYTDSWQVLHPSNPGITFNGTINKMLHEMWPLGRFYGFKDDIKMRLDRVFLKTNDWTASEIKICFNDPLYDAQQGTNIIKDILSTIFDSIGVNIARNPKHYLFPSDHFGLTATFHFK